MNIFKHNKIDTVWTNICAHEGEIFYTIRNKSYTYTVYDEYILINDDKRRRITKHHLQIALSVDDPSPAKLNRENVWGPSYVYGIITDSKIL